MAEIDPNLASFLQYWFGGLEEGLAGLPEAQRRRLIGCCGQACARSYTAAIFQQAFAECAAIPQFLEALARRFPGAHYQLRENGTIFVRYSSCGCDLVQLGWIRTPDFCDCSSANLAANFEAAVGRTVEVERLGSILDGQEACEFIVTL